MKKSIPKPASPRSPFQRVRGRIWSKADKAYLIDSIINGFDIPKFYVADFTWGDSSLNRRRLPYAIIDGKQRFEAIHDFFKGEVVLNDDFTFREDPDIDLSRLSYKDLRKNHPEIADAFDTASLTVMSVYAEQEERINELFVRLNRSKSLTGAEIRNAMGGPAPEVFRNIAKHEFFHNCIKFKTLRGADWNAAAKLVVFEYYDGPKETKKKNLDDFVKNECKRRPDHLELAARRVVDVLDSMAEIFLPEDSLLSSAGQIPVYYWFVRNTKPLWHRSIRSFLVEFERRRAENRALTTASDDADEELHEYDRLNRSTNDEKSHNRRYEIISERFELWE